MTIDVAIAIENSQTRERMRSLFSEKSRAVGSATSACLAALEFSGSAQGLVEDVEKYFREDRTRMLVLVSDILAQPLGPPERLVASECLNKAGEGAFGMIALTPSPPRDLEVDRVIRPEASGGDLERAFILVIERVKYLAPPPEHLPQEPASILVRPLKTANETELYQYFALRHTVYTVMGYLDKEIESCRSRLEVNEGDLHAIHLAAFDESESRMIGTARVVTMDEADLDLQARLESISQRDPVIRNRLSKPYLLGLPIFYHKRTTPIIEEVFGQNQRCGELSRVIVDRAFRGNGVSRALVAEAMRRSGCKGIQRIFLECLAVHEQLYEKHGFKRIPGIEGRVIDVGRTMIAMEFRAAAAKRSAADLAR